MTLFIFIALIIIFLISGVGELGDEYYRGPIGKQIEPVKMPDDVDPLLSQYLPTALFHPDSTVRG